MCKRVIEEIKIIVVALLVQCLIIMVILLLFEKAMGINQNFCQIPDGVFIQSPMGEKGMEIYGGLNGFPSWLSPGKRISLLLPEKRVALTLVCTREGELLLYLVEEGEEEK